MKINDVEIMILKKEEKRNKENQVYWILSLVTIEDGEVFNLIIKDPNIVSNLNPFEKTVVSFKLSNSKYGLSLTLE